MIKTFYKVLIAFGILAFIMGVIGDSKGISFLAMGLSIGPILYVIGVIIWIVKRAQNPIPFKLNVREYSTIFDSLMFFTIRNFFLEFAGMCAGIFMIMTLNNGLFTRSDAFICALTHIKTNEQIKREIGVYQEVGKLVGGTLGKEKSNLGFTVYGSNGGLPIRVSLIKKENQWHVESLSY